jgi:hypothetical protein
VAAVLFVTAVGIGLAMTPATDAIMSALPKAKFGVGSAVNDATREIGGALGVAVLGSLFAATYSDHLAGSLAGLPANASEAATQSLAGAAAVAQAVGGDAGAALLAAARQSFVDGMSWTAIVGIGFAVAGAVVAFAFLPDRVTAADTAVDEAAEGVEDETEPAMAPAGPPAPRVARMPAGAVPARVVAEATRTR